jgi:hypothetical protein
MIPDAEVRRLCQAMAIMLAGAAQQSEVEVRIGPAPDGFIALRLQGGKRRALLTLRLERDP